MNKKGPYKFESLSDLHRVFGLKNPLHPLLSLINNSKVTGNSAGRLPSPFTLNFYKIAYKPNQNGKLRYGQGFFDFAEGGLAFSSPNQVISSCVTPDGVNSGYTLFIHPDFLLTHPLSKKIKQFGFFSYSANEALFLSDREKKTIISIFQIIDDELKNGIDDFSQDVIISQIDSLLNYSNRFYKRQFITRKAVNIGILEKIEDILDNYLNNEELLAGGIPTVQYLSENLHLSSSYLSDMLRVLTGQNAQQHIQNKIIEKAKERLSTSTLSISEIAYELGFEHSQSFSRLFKKKVLMSPVEFRESFS